MRTSLRWTLVLISLTLAGALAASGARAQGTHAEVYGFVMTDAGFMGTRVDPNWFDTMRPTKLPSFKDQFGKDGQTFFGVRQSKIGVTYSAPVGPHELKTKFEFDMYGVGADAGQTTMRPRIFYGEWGQWGAGQTMSPFMDLDVFPNCLDYWGPNAMLFFRNPQIRWMPLQGEKSLTLAIERPGASGDQGVYADRIADVGTIIPSFPVPDLSGNYHLGQKWGYVQLGGIVRQIKWEDLNPAPPDLSGSVTGWGVQLSSNITRMKGNVLRLQGVYGEGIENYFNDAPVDVGAKPGDATKPVKGEALPITGVTAFIDHTWNERFSSTIGYSQEVIDNSAGQTADAFHMGQYALGNLLYTPDPKITIGAELGYEKRTNNADGFTAENWVGHVAFKYNFSGTLGGGQ